MRLRRRTRVHSSHDEGETLRLGARAAAALVLLAPSALARAGTATASSSTLQVSPQLVGLAAVAVVALVVAGVAVHRARVRDIRASNAELTRIVAEQGQRLDEASAQLARQAHELDEANRRLEALSTVDALTDVANRGQFDRALDAEWRRCARTGLPLALLMLDLDYFKAYNDGYGHGPGDACLRKVAAVIRRMVQRAGELVARYGGEEFAVLLPGSDAPHARDLAETIRLEVELLALPNAYSKVTSVVTISAGVSALIPIYGSTSGELIAAANRALYNAKQTGRNRVAVAPPA